MNKTYTRIFGPALVLGLCLMGTVSAQDSTAKPDNTKVNKQKSPTADNSKSNPGDRTLTAKVRKSLMADKTLSTYAHNVKIITQDGMVTLSGPVRTDAEKSTVEAKAKEIAGADKVVNQITIAPKK